MQVLICWGLMPLLLQGVGVPLARRTSSSNCLKSLPAATVDHERLSQLLLGTIGLADAQQLQVRTPPPAAALMSTVGRLCWCSST